MVDKKLTKARAKIEALEEELRAARFQVLNMRQMYEGIVGEKQAALAQLQRTNQMITGLAVQARGKTLKLKAGTISKLEGWAGVDTKELDGDLLITAVSVEDLQAMQDDIDDFEEEDEQA